MTGIKQRDELQSTIWKIAYEVRGAVDGWDFKQFVLETASSLQVLRPAGFTACFCYVLRKFHQIKIYEIAALW